MTTEELVIKINEAGKFEDVINPLNFKSEFNDIIKQIHPDKCTITGSADAMTKVNSWKDYFENGKLIKDDAGSYITNGYWVEFKEDSQNLKWSIENYRLFTQLQEEKDKFFRKYLPLEGKLSPDGKFKFIFEHRAIPLSGLTLEQKHTNWVINRLLEYATYLYTMGFSHCGLNPESVFIVPETHGIQIVSFYHLTRLGNKIGTISGKYSHWHPTEVFRSKMASSDIDIQCIKRIAAYLLGDSSGMGIKLRKTHLVEYIDFILSHSNDPLETLDNHKDIVSRNFKKEFHHLSI